MGSDDIILRHSDAITDVLNIVGSMRQRGLTTGSSTGYTGSLMNPLAHKMVAQGYRPDNIVAADDLSRGRRTPLAMYKCFIDLAVWPAESVAKIDDTAPGFIEGKAAGCITVGV